MKCPHCNADQTYRQRGGRRCSNCKREFAFEPRTDPLKLTDARFTTIVAKLSAGGTLTYSVEQLRYALAAKVVRAQKPTLASSVFGCSAVLSFVAFGALTFIFESLLAAIVTVLTIGLIAFTIWYVRRGRPFYPKVPIERERFERDVLDRFRKVYSHGPPGLIGGAQLQLLDYRMPLPSQLRGALVCPERAVLDCLWANGFPEQSGLALLPAGPPFTTAERDQLAVLRARPELPLLLLHDASPAGCLLAGAVAQGLDLGAGRRVIDLGLRPQTAIDRKLLAVGAPPDPATLERLRAQGRLAPEELEWLAQGRVAPVAALAPKRLLAIASRAAQRLSAGGAAPAQPTARAATPEERARAVGFLSWPEAR